MGFQIPLLGKYRHFSFTKIEQRAEISFEPFISLQNGFVFKCPLFAQFSIWFTDNNGLLWNVGQRLVTHKHTQSRLFTARKRICFEISTICCIILWKCEIIEPFVFKLTFGASSYHMHRLHHKYLFSANGKIQAKKKTLENPPICVFEFRNEHSTAYDQKEEIRSTDRKPRQ